MAGSVNKVILVGNLGADPEIRTLNSGDMVVNLRIATGESWRDKQTGERKERTEWHQVVIFNEGIAKVAEQYLKKGMKVYIEGQIQTRKWQDQQGTDRYTTEVVLKNYRGDLQMLESAGSNRPPTVQSPDQYGTTRAANYGEQSGGTSNAGASRMIAGDPGSGNFSRDLDDEIPL